MAVTIESAQRLFSPEGAYLNRATYGLPPRTAFEAFQAAADEWRHGRTSFEGWDRSVGAAREGFARIAGLAPARLLALRLHRVARATSGC